jgi:hypothetical protein
MRTDFAGLNINVDICSQDREKSIPARLVYVRKRGARKDYLALISTPMRVTFTCLCPFVIDFSRFYTLSLCAKNELIK